VAVSTGTVSSKSQESLGKAENEKRAEWRKSSEEVGLGWGDCEWVGVRDWMGTK
jgi:hypothetical protein